MPGFDPRAPHNDGVAPPLIQGLVGSGIERFSMLVGGFFRGVNEWILLVLWFGGGAGLALLVLVASIAQTPGWEGVARGLFAGLFLGLLYLAGFGSLFVGYRRAARAETGGTPVPTSALELQLAPTLRELDALRGAVDAGRVNRRVAGDEDDLLGLHRLRRFEYVERTEDIRLERLVRVVLHHADVLVGGEMEHHLRP